ncbi:MAG TPA: hypothetical protein VGE65_03750 [Sphingobium sp.]
MTPIQEFRFRLSNGDQAEGWIEFHSPGYSGKFLYLPKGERSVSGTILSHPTAVAAFEHLLQMIGGVGNLRRTIVTTIDNPNNTELLSRSSQIQTLSRLGATAAVLVNGKE